MTPEIEAAAIDSHREFARSKPIHVRPPGSACPNCDAILQGPWCHACGQSAEELHRSVRRLFTEAIESFTHFDGRFWRTVPALLLKPGKLTRAYISGHRAGQIPPLRLFLIALLLMFFAGSIGGGGPSAIITTTDAKGRQIAPTRIVKSLDDLTPDERKKVEKSLGSVDLQLGRRVNEPGSVWLKEHVAAAVKDPERFKLVLEGWAERFAFLMLPIAALLLSGLFAFQRRFYVFDHTIFALHSLAFQALLITVILLVRPFARSAADVLSLIAPIHLFLHMRGVYRTSVLGTLLRMFVLFVGSTVGFSFLLIGLLAVGLSAMTG